MQEQRVSYNTAVLAKEKGFDIVVSEWYDETGVLIDETSDDHVECMYANGDILCFRNGDIPNISTAPTQSLLQRWLREVHNIDIYCSPDYKKLSGDRQKVYDCMCVICKTDSPKMLFHMGDFPTFEEALEVGLFQALLLL